MGNKLSQRERNGASKEQTLSKEKREDDLNNKEATVANILIKGEAKVRIHRRGGKAEIVLRNGSKGTYGNEVIYGSPDVTIEEDEGLHRKIAVGLPETMTAKASANHLDETDCTKKAATADGTPQMEKIHLTIRAPDKKQTFKKCVNLDNPLSLLTKDLEKDCGKCKLFTAQKRELDLCQTPRYYDMRSGDTILAGTIVEIQCIGRYNSPIRTR